MQELADVDKERRKFIKWHFSSSEFFFFLQKGNNARLNHKLI